MNAVKGLLVIGGMTPAASLIELQRQLSPVLGRQRGMRIGKEGVTVVAPYLLNPVNGFGEEFTVNVQGQHLAAG
ncbi:MAG: hypothetical protein ACE5MB_01620 [Anaerolineae bacterium]